MELLDDTTIETALRSLRWDRQGDVLVKSVTLAGFAEALAWVNQVGALAEERDHHPDITISWNRVTLELTSHSDGGLTQADLDLAAAVDGLAATPP